MIVSLNWLKKFTDINMPVEELATLIGARLVEIEEVIDYGAKYKDVLIVKVVGSNKLEGSDHLSVTKIDDGGVTTDIERDENGFIQVVCGAPNIAAGQLVAWLPPKSTVPETYGKPEPFVLDTRELRGVRSNGMIASSRELALSDEHEGILVISDDVKPGTSFANFFELDDYLLDIENKSLTHRPDTFGIIGFAREIAAILGNPFRTPDWLMNLEPDFGQNNEVQISAIIDNPELSARYQAIVVSDADSNKKSPLLIQTYLSRVGVRPINAIVDITNYLMLLTGQPLHAFDYDKLVAVGGGQADIHVRNGRDKEKLTLLDGRTIELTTSDIVIAAGETAVALAGAMGGANTAIDANTRNIVIESATFNLYNLRSTQMRHGIFSEAITRFTKGQQAKLTAPVLSDAVRLMNEWACAKCVSKVAEAYPEKSEPIILQLKTNVVNDVLGSEFSSDEVGNTLKNVEFLVDKVEPDTIKITVPYWRADIHIDEDIAEEVGRLNGFDNIKPTLPIRDFGASRPNDFDLFRARVRKILARAGANEVLTYSFIHGDILSKAIQDTSNSYRIVNSISPSLQYYRQSLTPSLLEVVNPNIKQGFDNFAIFELNKVHKKDSGLDSENVPVETDRLALVTANKEKQTGSQYYKAKRIFDYLCKSLGVQIDYDLLSDESEGPLSAPFEPRRTAVVSPKGAKVIGLVGEYKKSVKRGFKLPDDTAGFEIDTRLLFEATMAAGKSYKPIGRYPSVERDICFQVERDINYGQIVDVLNESIKNVDLDIDLSPVDIYQPVEGTTKNITIHIRLNSNDHTLTNEEVNKIVDGLINSVKSQINVVII